MKFEVGEIATGQNFIISTELNGAEIEITSLPRLITPYDIGSDKMGEEGFYYGVKIKGNAVNRLKQKFLRKKKPPKEELSTWEEIQKLTSWTPEKVAV